MDKKGGKKKVAISKQKPSFVAFNESDSPSEVIAHNTITQQAYKASDDLRKIILKYSEEGFGFSEEFIKSITEFFARNYEPEGNLERILLAKDDEGRDLFKFFIDALEQRHQRLTAEISELHKDEATLQARAQRIIESDQIGRTFNIIFHLIENYIDDRQAIKAIVETGKDANDENLPIHLLKKMPAALGSLFYFMDKCDLLDKKNSIDLLPTAISARYYNYTQPLDIILPKLTKFLNEGVLSYNDLHFIDYVKIIKDGAWKRTEYHGVGVVDVMKIVCRADCLEKPLEEFSEAVLRRSKLDSSPKHRVKSAAGSLVSTQKATSTTCAIV